MEEVSTRSELLNQHAATAVQANQAQKKNYFLLSLLASTWLPILFFTLIASTHATGSFAATKAAFLFLGTAHVPATFFFYTDREFSAIIRSHRFRYIYVPIVITTGSGVLFATLGYVGQAFMLLIYWSWQAFHYGRQNVGVYAFASIAETGRGPHRFEKLAIDLGTILGIVGTFKVLGSAVAPAYLHGAFDRLYSFGAFAFLALLIGALIIYITFFRETTLFKTLFFFTSVFFFYPVYISTDMNIGFLSYAIAHGLQYLIFMSIVSATARREVPDTGPMRRSINYQSILKLGLFVLILGIAFWRVGDLRALETVKASPALTWLADFVFGAVLGATMSHFVVDANAWKLRLRPQRAYMSKRFAFVFERQPAE